MKASGGTAFHKSPERTPYEMCKPFFPLVSFEMKSSLGQMLLVCQPEHRVGSQQI